MIQTTEKFPIGFDDRFFLDFDIPENSLFFDELFDDFSGCSNSANINKKMLKKKRETFNDHKVNQSIFRTVPSKDVRRSYAEMLVNVTNSMDSLALKDFFQTYYNSDVRFVRSCPLPTAGNGTFQLSGIPLVCQFFHNFFHLVPDGVFRLHNSQIFTSDNHWETRIVSEFSHQGTIIYDFPVYAVIPRGRLGDMEVVRSEGEGGVSRSGGKYKHQLALTNSSGDGHGDMSADSGSGNTTNHKQKNNKRKRYMQSTSTILSSLDHRSGDKHFYDDSIIRNIDQSRLLTRTKTVDSAGLIIMHIGKDRNISSLEYQFTSSSVHEGWESIWY